MGYTTNFWGEIRFNKPVDAETKKLLDGLNQTRRMKRNVGPEYGVEGEFYIDGTGYRGQGNDSNIIDFNQPPLTQPGLWCQWRLTKDGQGLEWDKGEKFYDYIEWMVYLRDKVLNPAGITLESGEISWAGEDSGDLGMIEADNNKLKITNGYVEYKTDYEV